MAKDLEKEKEEQEEVEQKEEQKRTWWQKVPLLWKLGGLALLLIQYQRITSLGNDINELWTWVIVVLIAWFMVGSEVKKRDTGVLTPEEAMKSLKKEVQRMVNENQISKSAKIFIGPNSGLFVHEGIPQHYQIGILIINDYIKEHKRGIVFATGETRGYATIQDSPGRLTGREPIPVRTPKIFGDLKKKWDIDYADIFSPSLKK